MTDKTAVCGMFSNRREAIEATQKLVAAGVSPNDVSVLSKKNNAPHDFVHAQPSNIGYGAVVGGVVGLFIMSLVGFFIGFNSAGRFVNTITGAAIGLLIGMVAGTLSGIGIPKIVNSRYGFYLREGGFIVAAHVANPTDLEKAKQVLEKSGAQDVAGLYDAEVWDLALHI